MAGVTEKEGATVELADEGTITLDLSDAPELLETEKEGGGGEKTPAQVAEAAKAEKEQKKPVPRVKLAESDPTIALQKALDSEKKRREAAEATATAAAQRAAQAEQVARQSAAQLAAAQETVNTNQLVLLNNGIEAAAKQVASLKDQYRTALEVGDFVKAADIQADMGRATAQLDRLEAAKADFEARPAKTTEGAVEDQVTAAVTPQERYLSQYTNPRAQGWLRSHPECLPAELGGDPDKNAAMMEGHYAALRQKVAMNSDDYFRIIEEHTGHREPEVQQEQEVTPAKPAAKPKAPVAAAPVTRDPPAADGRRTQRTVTLTKEQQEVAKMSFPNLQPQQAFAEYARNMLALEAEGKLGRTSH